MKAVVIGSTVGGMECALALRGEGYSVSLVCASTYLGEDFNGTWRYFPGEFQREGKKRLETLLPGLSGDENAVLMPGILKKQFLSRMDESGIPVLFMTRAVGIEKADDFACCVTLADKLGVFREECDLIVDASLNRSFTCFLFGKKVMLKAGESAGVMLEYMGLDALFPLPGIKEAALFRGAVCEGHAFLRVKHTFSEDTDLETARAVLMRLSAQAARAVGADERGRHARLIGTFSPMLDIETEPVSERPVQNLYAPQEILDGMHRENRKMPVSCGEPAVKEVLCDVFVLGAGTAGVRAAFAAAGEGARVACAELFSTLGGTRTTGGVQPPYDGNRNRLFLKMWREISGYTQERCAGQTTNAACEALLYEEKMRQLGIELIRPALPVSAERNADELVSVLLAAEDCLYRVRARVFIDATGDADLAVLSGVKTFLGDAEMEATQNYSQFHLMSGTKADVPMADQDVMKNTDRSEWERALRQNTQRCSPYNMVEMLTVRESRRIEGRDTVKLSDIYRSRRPADAVYDCMSDYDTHSRCFSLPGRYGVLPSHAPVHFVSVPLGALLPKETENLLVCAKSISAEQEAAAHMRMSPDIMCVGHICGLLAACAVKTDARVGSMPIEEIQTQMYALGALVVKPHAQEYFETTAQMLASRLASGDESAFADAVLCNYETLPGLLREMLSCCAENNRLLMAKTLLYFSDTAFAPEIAQALKTLNDSYGVQRRRDVYRFKIVNGGDPSGRDEYWKINAYSMLLAKNSCLEYAPLLTEVMENTCIGEYFEPAMLEHMSIRPDITVHGNFDRFMCLAYAACLMPHPLFAKPLMRLYRLSAEDERCRHVFSDCWLHMKLAQAAWLCGSNEAHGILCEMLENRYAVIRSTVRGILSGQQKA